MKNRNGKRGAHYDALKLLLTEIGRAHDIQYVLRRYKEPDPAERQDNMHRTQPDYFDARPARDNLSKILEQLNIGQFQVTMTGGARPTPFAPLEFIFTITTRTTEDYNTLTVPREDNALPMTMVGALGTLFRAYGNRNGVKFAIDVQKA